MSADETNCLFCRIARGEIPAVTVHADERIVAFLDISPIRPGHVQIIPRAHHDYFDDLPAALAAGILALGQRLAKAQKAAYGVERVSFLFAGGDVRHAHAHLVPMVEPTDITSRRYIAEESLTFRTLPHPGQAALDEVAATLRFHLARLG
ncbi:HIT family protein [Acuticoccus sediminis]|uniref:HIT family protein n=1 Tax=Acuticoccus sediminis TaxID=2184697 RepID=A0A8B2P065_9HYPH|nr:HIT domain-containing protein [Acuticoccus sediminis]RAI04370.1 HIT family protein [Acuticoccus sediminis]